MRGVRSSSGAPARLSFLLPRGDISTGRILPPHGRDRGSSPRRSTRTSRRSWVSVCKTPHGHPLFVRRFRDRSSTGRAPDRQSGGSRFDSDRFHRAFGLRGRRPLCCSGPDSGAPAWYAGDGECNSREQLSLGDGPEARTWSNGQDGRTPPCRRRFDSCCPLLFTCGGSSMVEREAAKLATGVRFPFTAPSVTRTWPRGRAAGLHPVHAGSTPAVRSLSRSSGEARRSAKSRARVRFPAGSPRHVTTTHFLTPRGVAQPGKSACLGDRRLPVRIRPPRPTSHPLSRLRAGEGLSSPSASWPRQPDSQSGDAGSNPAGDTGPTRRPARLPRGARPGGRAHQRRPARPSRAPALLSLSWRPGTVLRTRSPRFDSSQGGHALALAAPDAGLRSLSTRVRLPARAPQGGTVPGEAHNLAAAGSIPAPASATTHGERWPS